MEKQCVVCNDRKATLRCISCHKPICDDCAFKNTNGAFCSRDCSADYESFKKTKTPEKGKGGVLTGVLRKLVVLLILLVAAGAVYVYGAKQGWFGEKEKKRVQEQEERIEEKWREGEEKLQELEGEARESIEE